MEEIPQPTVCMVQRGGSHTEYVACNNSFENGCRDLEKPSNLKTIISLTPTSDSGSTISNYVEHSNRSVKSNGNASDHDCSWHTVLKVYKYHLLALGGVLSTLMIIIDLTCIYWCVKYKVKNKLQSTRKGEIQEISCRPITEAMARIYRNMNFDGNSNYDLVSNRKNATKTYIFYKEIDSAHYDKGFFRLITESGNYDSAWSNICSTQVTHDVEYDLVRNVGNLKVPEEEIYSKQILDPEDFNTQPETSAKEK
ncbi:uncharacterized protein LOC134265691 isoform X2 [Saccostrea cucullata]|uniref:uncharacterized protein LOC134265691 isoform X2 n=1 Tax=Saccostrea cuccullata TaxID=36930 RepID=UPI002ED43EDD